MVVLAVQDGECIQFGLEPRTTSQHCELAAAPIGDVVPADVTIEGVLLEHDLLGAVLADDEEGRVAVDHSGGRGVGQLHSGLAHIHADLVVEFGHPTS